MNRSGIEVHNSSLGARIYRIPLDLFPSLQGYVHVVIRDNIVALIDGDDNPDTYVYYIEKHDSVIIPLSDIDPTWTTNELDTGDGEVLSTFVNYVISNYPAQHYGLELDDHGSGYKGICYDYSSSSSINMCELEAALSSIKKHNDNKPTILLSSKIELPVHDEYWHDLLTILRYINSDTQIDCLDFEKLNEVSEIIRNNIDEILLLFQEENYRKIRHKLKEYTKEMNGTNEISDKFWDITC